LKKQSIVYIVLINFGQWKHTIECLESILANNFTDFRVIVVDVQDIDQSLKNLTNWKTEIDDQRFSILPVTENKGFAFANNLGIKEALKNEDCEFIWILNNDTVIHSDALAYLYNDYRKKQENNNLGIFGSKILDFYKRDIIQNVGGTFNPRTGYSTLIGMGEKDNGQFDDTESNFDYVVGASMFFHRNLIKKIGLMPDCYFLFCEDIDWSLTARKAGFTNSICTSSMIYHKQGVSTGAKLLNSDLHLKYKKYLHSSYKILYKRHFPSQLPIAYFILFKQLAGKIYRRNFAEAKLILNIIFSKY